jgi:hypothetical protein
MPIVACAAPQLVILTDRFNLPVFAKFWRKVFFFSSD